MPRLGNEDGLGDTTIKDWCVKEYGSVDEYIGGGGFAWWDFCTECAADLEGEPIAEYLHIVGKSKVGTGRWVKTFEEPCGEFSDWGVHLDYEGEVWKDDDGELHSDYTCECCEKVLRGSDCS